VTISFFTRFGTAERSQVLRRASETAGSAVAATLDIKAQSLQFFIDKHELPVLM
jgi:hypothetical protein